MSEPDWVKDATKKGLEKAAEKERLLHPGYVSEVEKQTTQVTVFPDETEEEAVQRVREAKATLLQRHRDDVLYNSADIVSSLKALPDVVVHHPFPTPVPIASEWKEAWKKQPPQKIAEKLKDLKEFSTELEDFSKNFDAYALKNIPCNWQQSFATKEDYLADVRKIRHEDFETVEEAKKYVAELIRATNEALLEKQAELDAHKGEINPLVKQCKKLVAELNRLHPDILKAKRKAEITVLEEKEIRKIVQLVHEYEELNKTFDTALGKLALISKSETLNTLRHPLGLPVFPGQIERARNKIGR